MKNYIEVAYSQKEKPLNQYPNKLVRYLADRFSFVPNGRLLDNGCGRGDFLHAFAELGLETYGTDISEFCRETHVVNFEHEALPFPDDFFDVVFSKSVIEHIGNCEHYMNEMKRVLKKGGLLILMVPDWKSQYKIFYEDPTHIHAYCVKSIERLLAMNDYERYGAEIFYQLPFMWKHPMLKKLDVFGGSVSKVHKNKTYRFLREKMVLGWGYK